MSNNFPPSVFLNAIDLKFVIYESDVALHEFKALSEGLYAVVLFFFTLQHGVAPGTCGNVVRAVEL